MNFVEERSIRLKRILHFRPVFYGFMFLLFGVLFARQIFSGDFDVILSVLLVATITVLLCCYFNKLKRLLFLTMAFVVGLGLFFAGYADFVGREYDGQVSISGRVQDGYYENETYYRVVLDSVVVNGQKERNVQVYIYKTTSDRLFNTGEILTFDAVLKNVELFTSDGSLFSPYLRNNTPYTANVSESKVTVDDGGLTMSETLRENIKDLLDSYMSENGSAVAYASLFGDKGFVIDSIYDIFRDAGLLHLLAVSGLHVGFLVAILNFVLDKLKVQRIYSFLITGVILLFYAVLCSFTPSVMRAAIMCLVVLGSRLFGRQYDGLNSLGISGLLIALASPLTLLDGGFLMSFFAVFAIFTLHKPLSEFFGKFVARPIAEPLALTIVAQIGVLPFLADFYGTVNFLSIFANLLLVPLFSVMFTLLFIIVVIGLIFPFVGVLLYIVDFLLWLIVWIAGLFASAKIFIVTLKPMQMIFKLSVLVGIFMCSRFVMIKNQFKALFVSAIFAFCSVLMIFY